MINHKFIPIEFGEFLVKCKKTGGEFSTILWKIEKVPKGICLCCYEEIKKK